ncbi:hypothetical protein J4E83_007180 [Alternaria metachromatica]|uniref:uncharacterized protein n=1 Tax=Alternaria metachromatica TaxID=283354 RepID=UPI0020C2E82D|nr:uncharacterized protein J4E83_007180 [Alternaria metachromatica]KAI4614526.1 hypothetical protein J4E83_007180 [Alternaria metachromatica]
MTQTFDYMRLPTELRFMVLEALIGPAIWPRAKVECRNCYADDNSSEPCYALLESQGERSTIDDETIIYDSEDEELPALESVSEIEKSERCVHVAPLENEPRGLASLFFQTAGWPKTIGIDIPYEVTKPTYGCRKPHRLGSDVFSTDGLSRKNAHWMRSLLLVSRQFSFEFQKMLWESTIKRYTRLHTMGASIPLLHSVKFKTGFNTLSRLALSMSNSQLFRLLGFRSSWKRGFKPCTSSREVNLDMLTNLNLDHLHFDFQIPKTPFSDERNFITNDPWRHVHDVLCKTASCQRKFVDLFFVLAFDRLRNVPKVTFSGYFKKSNLETWEDVLAVSRKTLDYDMTSKVSTIMSMPADKL